MVFPHDVQGTYRAPERDIGAKVGIKELRSVVAVVTRDTIVFREIPYSKDLYSQDVIVYSTNTDSTGYPGSSPGKGTTEQAIVGIDSTKHYGATEPPASIVFTGTGKTLKRMIPGGTESTPVFIFSYKVPRFDDQPWKFTKTNETSRVQPGKITKTNETSRVQPGKITKTSPDPDPTPVIVDDPDPKPEKDSNMITLAVVLMVVAAIL